jgi:integrase
VLKCPQVSSLLLGRYYQSIRTKLGLWSKLAETGEPFKARWSPILMALRRMDLESKVTGHGFRSTFTDWAHETTNFPGLVVEMALNHVIKDKTEAA